VTATATPAPEFFKRAFGEALRDFGADRAVARETSSGTPNRRLAES